MKFCVFDANCSVYDSVAKLPGYSRASPLCEGCRRRAESELHMLRLDYIDLSQLVPPAERRNDEAQIFRPKPESKPPIAIGVFTLRGDIAYVVLLAERVLRRFMGDRDTVAFPVREGFALDHGLRYLESRVDALAELPATDAWWDPLGEERLSLTGPQVLMLFGSLHRRARRVCGLAARTIIVPGDCPQCGMARTLRRLDDNPEKIWCVSCGQKLSQQDYLRGMRMQFARPGDIDVSSP